MTLKEFGHTFRVDNFEVLHLTWLDRFAGQQMKELCIGVHSCEFESQQKSIAIMSVSFLISLPHYLVNADSNPGINQSGFMLLTPEKGNKQFNLKIKSAE